MKLTLIKNKIKAFTLIELLVVIVIIGILSGLIVVSINGAVNSANDAKRKSNISAISRAILTYGVTNGNKYPVQSTQCDVGSNCANLTSALADLMPILPVDPNGARYKYFSYDGSSFTISGTLSNGTFALGPVQQCPTDWIDSGHGFCVMKYEARSGAISTATGAPQVSITQTAAIAACAALGNGSHLITNAEWTILARDIEGVNSNWSGGSVGSGTLARGWAASTSYGDSWTNSAVAATTDSSCLYNTGANACGSTGSLLYRRTHTLQNGEVIWDLSGNVYEWTNDTCTVGTGAGNWQGAGWIEWDNSALADYEKAIAGPAGNYTSTNATGRYYGCSANGNAFLRSGNWHGGSYAGVFALHLYCAPSGSHTHFVFRCAR